MKKTTKKANAKTAKKAEAKRISEAQKNRNAVETKAGALKLAKAKERSHPESPKRQSQTDALHSETAQKHYTSGKALTAGAIAEAVKKAVQDYDFKNDGYTPEAMRATLDHIRQNADTANGNIIDVKGIMSRNDKAGDQSALAYWGLWSAKQYINNPTEDRTDSMHITITAQTANGTGINHLKSAKGKAKIKAMNLV